MKYSEKVQYRVMKWVALRIFWFPYLVWDSLDQDLGSHARAGEVILWVICMLIFFATGAILHVTQVGFLLGAVIGICVYAITGVLTAMAFRSMFSGKMLPPV